MERWGAALYGDPCRACGFIWSISLSQAIDLVSGVPERYRGLLEGRDGSLRHPELGWTAGGYVCHVVDNLRIWGERLAGAALGGERSIPGYDQALLGEARSYNQIAVPGALWSLGDAAVRWVEAMRLAVPADVVLLHATRGPQRTIDVARNNAHDAYHHGWDIERTLRAHDRS